MFWNKKKEELEGRAVTDEDTEFLKQIEEMRQQQERIKQESMANNQPGLIQAPQQATPPKTKQFIAALDIPYDGKYLYYVKQTEDGKLGVWKVDQPKKKQFR